MQLFGEKNVDNCCDTYQQEFSHKYLLKNILKIMLTFFLVKKQNLEHYDAKPFFEKKKFRKSFGFSNLDIFFVHF